MTKITYTIVEHDGGWAYRVDGTFSEAFASLTVLPVVSGAREHVAELTELVESSRRRELAELEKRGVRRRSAQ